MKTYLVYSQEGSAFLCGLMNPLNLKSTCLRKIYWHLHTCSLNPSNLPHLLLQPRVIATELFCLYPHSAQKKTDRYLISVSARSLNNPSHSIFPSTSSRPPFSCPSPLLFPGFFRYQFTSPGVYYYSSGLVDSNDVTSLQGVVTVRAVEEKSTELHVTVGGFTALSRAGKRHLSIIVMVLYIL